MQTVHVILQIKKLRVRSQDNILQNVVTFDIETQLHIYFQTEYCC